MKNSIKSDLAGLASGLSFAVLAEWGVQTFHPIPVQSEAAWMLFALGGAAFLAGNYAARGVVESGTANSKRQAPPRGEAD